MAVKDHRESGNRAEGTAYQDLTHIELTRKWIADLSSVINVSGEISQYLDSLEDAWRLYLEDVTVKLEEEMRQIDENWNQACMNCADRSRK
ncbi:MAG: hypothetical protein MZV63_12335 [Marinilabiliales bacterium]|nr:hypothetical protein [Marinilabiliales bacterium]